MWHRCRCHPPAPLWHSMLGPPTLPPHAHQGVVPVCQHSQTALQPGQLVLGCPRGQQGSEWHLGSVLKDQDHLCTHQALAQQGQPSTTSGKGGPVAQPPPRVQVGTEQAALGSGARVTDAQAGGLSPSLAPKVRQGRLGPACFPLPWGCATLQPTPSSTSPGLLPSQEPAAC